MNHVHTDTVETLYRATTTPRLVRVPQLRFLYLDGHGDPNTSPELRARPAYAVVRREVRHQEVRRTAPVSPLEGLFWSEDPAAFTKGDKADWSWRLLIRQPDRSTQCTDRRGRRTQARGTCRARRAAGRVGGGAGRAGAAPRADDAEAPTIAAPRVLAQQGLAFDGRAHKHHEIYLGDPRRAAPEKLRTIIRQSYAG